MSRSSTKNLLITSFLWLLSIGMTSHAAAATSFANSTVASAAKSHYQLKYDARYGVHTVGEPSVATNRQTVEGEYSTEFTSNLSSVVGARAEVEAAYGSLPERYSTGDVAKYESQTFLPRDIYLQYKEGGFRGRVGYQQVVWGESFGLYYADIVNPKDFRNAGLGDLAHNRLAIPMVNFQWITAETSVQVLYIPLPTFNLIPSSGSDFNGLLLPPGTPPLRFNIGRQDPNPPISGEYGLRVSQQFSGLDMSFFYLNYYDRMPVYTVQVIPSPAEIRATPHQRELQSLGSTLTYDLDGYLIRSELINHFDRQFNTISGTNVGISKSSEIVYVIGIDMPPVDKWQAGLQFAESRITDGNWLLRKAIQTSISARVGKTFENQISIEALTTYFISDQSNLLQASTTFPVSSQSEFLVGADIFSGDAPSELGRFKNASRAWVMFRTTIKK